MRLVFILCVGSLLFFGLVILASASANYSYIHFGSIYYLVIKQFISLLVGLIVFLVATRIDIRLFDRHRSLVYFIALILLSLVFVPALTLTHAGAKRWLDFGITTVQPTEFVKVIFPLLATSFVLSKRISITNFNRGFLRINLALLPIFLLIALQPDLDGLVIVLATFLLILYLGRAKFSHISFLLVAAALSFFAILTLYPSRFERLTVFLAKGRDPLRAEYHINQALKTISGGGFFGSGYGKGLHQTGYLPESSSDSIFAVLVGETGFVGAFILILLYLTIFLVGTFSCLAVRNDYVRIVGVSLLFMFIFQAYLNIASNLALIPFSGLTLPLFGYGGSSLTAYLFGLGIVYNIITNENLRSSV